MAATENLDGRVAIVTGAGKGLGRAYALGLAARGCAVVVNNRIHPGQPSSAQMVVDEIERNGGSAIAHDGPVETAEAGREMVALAKSRFGRLDILVCNAGISRWANFAETDVDEMRDIIDVNLLGTLYPLHAAWRSMLADGYGRIILTGSGAGLWGQPTSVYYCATKASVIGIARGLTLDVPKDADICVNVIAPAAYTPLSSRHIDARWADFLSPDHVTPLVSWLANEECRDSGMIFHVGAGRVQRVRIVEGIRAELSSAPIGEVVNSLTGAVEPVGSFGAGKRLMPEMFEDFVVP